jgi:hypothetical protein
MRNDEMKRTVALPWKLPAAGRILLVLAGAAALGCDLKPKPEATDLTATPEAITLIQETKSRCMKIAKTGLERVRSAEEEVQREQDAAVEAAERSGVNPDRVRARFAPSSETAENVLDKYLSDEAAPELAAVDRAGELVRDLLPDVKKEAPAELAQAVQALSTGEEQVCRNVRSAKPGKSKYQESLDYAVRDYDAAEAKLQNLYTVSATDAQFALSKFNPLLDQARGGADSHPNSSMKPLTPDQLRQERKEWQATQEVQQQQQAQHDAAVIRWRQRQEGKQPILGKLGVAPDLAAKENLAPEKRRQTMQSWSATYARKVAPVHAALESYLSLRRSGTQEQLQPVCQSLLDSTTALNADPVALDPPDVVASRALKKAYGDLQECARSCVNGLSAEAAFRLAYYKTAISEAATALQPFNVTP